MNENTKVQEHEKVEAQQPSTIERLSQMTQEEVDDLPYGFVVLDLEGVVLLYNRYEQQMSRIPADRVIGKSFFRELAPCARVEAFFGRFRKLAEQPPGATERFSFRFHFLHGAQDVSVQFSRAPDDRVFMTVHRVVLKNDAEDYPATLQQELDHGRIKGPLGVLLPLGWEQVAGLLSRIGSHASRELGRGIGGSILRVADRVASRAGAASLDQAPVPLAVGALDDLLAQLGFGRLAVDVSAWPRRVACFVRPPVDSPSVELSALYEGLLEVGLSAALGAPHAARCIEGTELDALPWRFVLVPSERAHELESSCGERPDDLANRFGLLDGSAEVSASGDGVPDGAAS
jgi:photoactive yellow protein